MNSAYAPYQAQPSIYAVPQQPDSLEQAARVIDIVDRIAGRRGGGAGGIEPGLSNQGAFNVGQFQGMPMSALQQQELMLRNPVMGQATQQQLMQVQQLVNSYSQVAQQALGDQKKAMHLAEVMHQAFMSMCNYTGELERAVNMGQIMHQAFTQMCNYAWELERTVSVLSTAPIAMQAYQQELDAAHRLIDVAHHMLTNPIYLLEHSFATFAQNIDANDAPFVSVLSRLYMALVEKHENMVQQQTGRYSDSYQQYLQSQIGKPWQQPMQQNLPPFPQSPQGNPPQNPGGLNANAVAFIKNMNQPGFGRMMQQNHVNQRQMRGM